MNKKASLSLSITAIVVIVIAFVVLGLGLTLTKTIFKGAEAKLPEAFALTQLEAEPTSENPITLQRTIDVERNEQKLMNVGFYNSNFNSADNAVFQIVNCLGENIEDKLPQVESIPQTVGPSEAAGYQIKIIENGMPADTYICQMAVCNEVGTCEGADRYETKQFFLRVVA